MSPRAERTLPPVRASLAVLGVLALLCVCLLEPTGAAASSIEGGNSFSELSSKAQEEEPRSTSTTSTTSTESGESHNSSTILLVGLGAAVVLLLAIGFVIVRDARHVAPAGAEDFTEGKRASDRVARRRNRRAKAKAARRQRKKNR
ncbi:MAG TPA: hypothetical protein VNV44_12125 [Solirubrobacteraceae bacterium]|nr:hypothetical protein [Solirubrobacteraceae bacterium]